MSSAKEILIVAGEASGDRHGAAVVREMKSLQKGVSFFGIGGNRLSQAGVELVEHADRMAVMGFFEVVLHYRFLRNTFNRLLAEIDKRKPARAILIDYPGFNLRLARELKKRDIPVTYYISPQLWAWKERRISIIQECVDQMICIFPFEEEWYREHGVEARFVGHPFMDEGEAVMSRRKFFDKHGVLAESPVLALMPGSRQQEVNRHLAVMVSAAERLVGELGGRAVIGQARGVTIPSIESTSITVERDAPESALEYSTVGIVSSGTVSLQAAVYGVPSVVIYRMNPLSWRIAKKVSKVDYASMANLIAGKQVLPELLQGDATSERIYAEVRHWLESDDELAKTRTELSTVRAKLGSPGASTRVAQLILDRLG